jgi:hypothetical protein|tara:strand:+ start:445 stop:624 length:180 start_codon:yes stop_codon:yes gene_type:complete
MYDNDRRRHIRRQFMIECASIVADIESLTNILNETDLPKDYNIPWDEILKPIYVGITIH